MYLIVRSSSNYTSPNSCHFFPFIRRQISKISKNDRFMLHVLRLVFFTISVNNSQHLPTQKKAKNIFEKIPT